MTVETSTFVHIPASVGAYVLDLRECADAALRRAQKRPPGDRTELVRFESIHAVIDQIATAALANGEPFVTIEGVNGLDARGTSVLGDGRSGAHPLPPDVARWLAAGAVVVELHLPHLPGETHLPGEIGVGPPVPAARWQSTRRPAEVVRERFEALITHALEDGVGAIMPSGITNAVLTEGLRSRVEVVPGAARVDVPVRYRDGSYAAPFPLRCLRMSQRRPDGWRVLRVSLLSIRHVEMDRIVDGAWLRNARVSRVREAGLTDQVVFDTSRRQLQLLTRSGPTLLYMYQTGLESAILGFYRAVVHHLLEAPGTLAVVPCYFRGGTRFTEGTPWVTA